MKVFKCTSNERGQALAFAVSVMVIALALGVGISLRTLSTVRRVTQSDTSSRVLAAAEGGLENFLVRSIEELSALAESGDITTITYAPPEGSTDVITTKADVAVEEFGDVEYPDNFEFALSESDTYDLILGTYGGDTIEVCWDSTSSNYGSDLYYSVYEDTSGGAEEATIDSCEVSYALQVYCGEGSVESVAGTASFTNSQTNGSDCNMTVKLYDDALDIELSSQSVSPGEIIFWEATSTEQYVEAGEATFEVSLGGTVYTIDANYQETACYYGEEEDLLNNDLTVVPTLDTGYTGLEVPVLRNGVAARDRVNQFPGDYENNFESANACTHSGFEDYDGYEISLSEEATHLRFRVLNHDSNVVVFPSQDSSGLPVQGYKITSTGSISTDIDGDQPVKEVVVYRKLPGLPSLFDFGIYTDSGVLE